MINESSKRISKVDDASKQMQIDCLMGDDGHGFDIDTIYFVDGRWCVFEYLKCESNYVTPFTSDPNKYPKNWKKFHLLFKVAQMLKGDLILVNYSVRQADKDQVKVMKVKNLRYDYIKEYVATALDKKPKNLQYIEYEWVKHFTLKEYSDWLRDLNGRSRLYPLD